MVRRVVFGLSVLGLCGTLAVAAPVISVEETGSNLQAGQFQAGQSYTFNIYVSDLSSATTNNGAISGSNLIDYRFVFKMDKNRDNSVRDNSDQAAITVTSFTPVYQVPGALPTNDSNLNPEGPFGAVDGGHTGLIFTDPTALGNTKTLLATFSINIAEDGDASNTFLYIAAGHRGNGVTGLQSSDGPGDGTYNADALNPNTMLTIALGGQNRGVNNVTFGSPNVEASGLPLVPEPATIALMLAACGGGLVSRRRRD